MKSCALLQHRLSETTFAAQFSGSGAGTGLVAVGDGLVAVGAVGVVKKSEFAGRALTDDEECSICLELVNELSDFQLPW